MYQLLKINWKKISIDFGLNNDYLSLIKMNIQKKYICLVYLKVFIKITTSFDDNPSWNIWIIIITLITYYIAYQNFNILYS